MRTVFENLHRRNLLLLIALFFFLSLFVTQIAQAKEIVFAKKNNWNEIITTIGRGVGHSGKKRLLQIDIRKYANKIICNKTGEVINRSESIDTMMFNLRRQCRAWLAVYAKVYWYKSIKILLFAQETPNQLRKINADIGGVEKEGNENINLLENSKLKAIETRAGNSPNIIYGLGILLGLLNFAYIFMMVRYYSDKKKLDYANTTKDKLLSIIAHDLSGAMGNIKILTDLVQDTDTEHEKEEIIKLLQTASSATFLLVKDLLSWTLTQTNGFKLNTKRQVIKSLINVNIELLKNQSVNKSIVVKNHIDNDLVVYADSTVLAIIFRNLLSNAIKFTKEGGSIIFDAEKLIYDKKPMIRVTIHDSGIGMDSVLVKRLLTERTIRSKEGTAKEHGNGIGFNLIRDFVNASNGYISIESKPGKGTAVHIYLPEYMKK